MVCFCRIIYLRVDKTDSMPVSIEQRRETLNQIVAQYIHDRYRVISQTDTTAQLIKPKKLGRVSSWV